MSGIASIVEVLLVEDKVGKKPNAQGVIPQWKEMRAVLRKEDGSVATVGMMRIPRDLEGQVVQGNTYQIGYGLGVLDYGDRKGEIQPVIAAFIHMDPKAVRRIAPTPAAA